MTELVEHISYVIKLDEEGIRSSCQLINYILSSVTELVEHISYLIKLDEEESRELVSTA